MTTSTTEADEFVDNLITKWGVPTTPQASRAMLAYAYLEGKLSGACQVDEIYNNGCCAICKYPEGTHDPVCSKRG